MTTAPEQQVVAAGEAQAELARVLASPEFAASQQLSSFLQFVVTESLAGRGDRLKERTVARGALGRDGSFDPRLDCVVRVVAGKLRRALDRYYAHEGAAHPVCIDVPKGSYCPVFRRTQAPPAVQVARANGNARPQVSGANGSVRPIIAVVPLESFTGGPKERFLADLLADDVAVRLSRLHRLEVIDCLATRLSGKRMNEPCAIAARLNADFVFAGTVSRVGQRIRLTVRLIDAHSGVLVWMDQYDRDIDDGPLAQQDDIADRIANSVGGFFGDVA